MARRIIGRHSIKPKGDDKESEKYKGISENGVLRARASAESIIKYVEASPAGSVIFLAGVSDAVRTKSTAKVYAEELERAFDGKRDYIFVSSEDFKEDQGKYNSARDIQHIILSNPGKKIIIDAPLYVKEFSLKGSGWFEKDGKTLTPFAQKLLEKAGGDERKAAEYWIEHGSNIDGLKGPDPNEVARRYEKGMSRLEDFARKYAGNRPYITTVVGHSWDTDAYITWLAGGGKVNKEIFDKVANGHGMINETEMAQIHANPYFTDVTYRGKTHRQKALEHVVSIFVIGSFLLSLFFYSGITGNVIGINLDKNYLGILMSFITILGAAALLKIMKLKRRMTVRVLRF